MSFLHFCTICDGLITSMIPDYKLLDRDTLVNDTDVHINPNSAPLTGCAACSLISDVMHNGVDFVVSYLAFLSPIEAVRGCRA